MNINEINIFIDKIKYLHKVNQDINKLINIEDLINSLQELDDLIEIYNVKLVIIGHIKALIVSSLKNKSLENTEEHMLHTVFYGEPGVGKSKTARILAKIWESLGVIRNTKSNVNCEMILNKSNETRDAYIDLYKNYIIPEYKDCKTMWKHNEPLWNSLRSNFTELGNLLTKNIENKEEKNDYIIVAGREDFVAEYSGQTSIKTLKFLNSCRGKCIIIEEAYVLYNSENDNYGMEALTVLNRFMDENPKDIIIIFTGYEHKLKSTIFKAQPGLMRRCQWIFNLKGYSHEGLFRIFKSQLKSKGWRLEDNENIVKFFEENYTYFSNFGGDTLKLVYQCKMIYSEKEMEIMFQNSGISDNDKIITYEIILKAFELYKNNHIHNEMLLD
jgi:hypothetical protein